VELLVAGYRQSEMGCWLRLIQIRGWCAKCSRTCALHAGLFLCRALDTAHACWLCQQDLSFLMNNFFQLTCRRIVAVNHPCRPLQFPSPKAMQKSSLTGISIAAGPDEYFSPLQRADWPDTQEASPYLRNVSETAQPARTHLAPPHSCQLAASRLRLPCRDTHTRTQEDTTQATAAAPTSRI